MSSFTAGNPAGRFALMVSLLPAFALFGATEYFVDRSRPDDTGDGKSVETAKRTIQAAVDAAASGDTVTVLPGVYDEGENADKDGMPNRVVIDNKKLTIRSRDGRDSTHIVGFHDPQPEDAGKLGLGQDAVRCVCIQGYSSPADI